MAPAGGIRAPLALALVDLIIIPSQAMFVREYTVFTLSVSDILVFL